MKNLPAKFARALALQSRAAIVVELDQLTLRASGGTPITTALRDELLAKCAAGQYVELEIDLLAFEQRTGEHNRNHVRFRDGALMSLGATGKGTPFLRDHNQYDTLSVGGVIVESKTKKLDDGHYKIQQTAKLTATWAVELALRGLLRAVSIGWRPTGPVLCSAHNTPVFSRCYCWPGDRLTERTEEDGSKRKVRSGDGEIVVEWIYTAAELIETSGVPIGAVPTASIDEEVRALRAELAADGSGFRAMSALKESSMEFLAALVAALSLAPTASETDVLNAVKKLKVDHDTLAAKNPILAADLATLRATLATHEAAKKKSEEDAFITDALSTGRIGTADDAPWRKLFALNADEARGMMQARPVGTSTPVGTELQSGKKPAEPETKTPATPELSAHLVANGAAPAVALEMTRQLGVKPEYLAQASGLGKAG